MDVFTFQNEGRTFTCQPESSPGTPGVFWWWVTVSGDAQRYGAFRTSPDDTQTVVKRRVVAYYDEVLATRARPRITRPQWNERRAAAAAPAANAQQAAPEVKVT
jgi:hypothetical protein